MLPLLIGAGSLTAAGIACFGAMAPQSELFGKTFHHGSDPQLLALTYDDGPNDPWTPRLLEILAKHDVKATFFLIGKWVKHRPDITRAIAAAGHEIGNHTYTHANLAFCSPARIRQELEDCRAALQDVIGQHSALFRPPWGARRPAVLQIAKQLGLQPVMWSVTCYDWKPTTAERVMQHVARQTQGGDVILMHDGGQAEFGADRAHTVAATEQTLKKYSDAGKRFVTIGEMRNAMKALS